MRDKTWVAALLLLAACTTGPSSPSPGAPAPAGARTFAYGTPIPAAVTYTLTDTTVFDIQGGAIGEIHAASALSAVADVAFSEKAGGVLARIRVTNFVGSFSNSAAGVTGAGPTATEADIEGAAVVSVTPTGSITIDTMPKLTSQIQRIGMSSGFFRRFFVRLPADAVRPGAMWVDTVDATDESGGSKVEVHDVVTSRFVRDTVAAGRALALIATSTVRTVDISGTNEGVQIAQKLSGTGSGMVLWDPERHVVVLRTETAELNGTFDLPQMSITGLPVKAHGAMRLALK